MGKTTRFFQASEVVLVHIICLYDNYLLKVCLLNTLHSSDTKLLCWLYTKVGLWNLVESFALSFFTPLTPASLQVLAQISSPPGNFPKPPSRPCTLLHVPEIFHWRHLCIISVSINPLRINIISHSSLHPSAHSMPGL